MQGALRLSSPSFKDKILEREALAETLWDEVEKIIEAREAEFTLPFFLYLSRHFYLEEIDARWIDHLKTMEALREGIGLRGYGQKDPKQEYKKEGFVLFGEMMASIQKNVCEKLFHVQIRAGSRSCPGDPRRPAPLVPSDDRIRRRRRRQRSGQARRRADGAQKTARPRPVRRAEPKVGRNDPCPCGSGKKYKKCHGSASATG